MICMMLLVQVFSAACYFGLHQRRYKSLIQDLQYELVMAANLYTSLDVLTNHEVAHARPLVFKSH